MTKWECTECSSNHTMPRDFGCDDCDQEGAMKGREYVCGDHLVPVRECGCEL